MDEPRRTAWQRLRPYLRWAGTAAGIAYVAHVIDPAEVEHAFGRISGLALAAAAALVALNVCAGAQRWRQVLAAYGAQTRPGTARATRLYFVSFFYNNYLPGAVAGDVVRGVVTRSAFGEAGAAASLAVVFVERALGLFGVFLLLALGLGLASDAIDTGTLWVWSALGITGSLALVLALPFARRIARILPGPLRRIAERVPTLRAAGPFVVAALLSITTQTLIMLAGWVLLHAVDPRVGVGSALLIVPLAAATSFLPITVGGAGAREAVYVMLGASLFHMPRGDALAASLALWLANLIVGGLGGLLQLGERARR